MSNKHKVLAALTFVAMLLGGCATSHNAAENTTDASGDQQVKFPARSTAWLKEGTFPNEENLRKIRTGMSKNQLYALIDKPHFSEGLFGPKQWNYIFNFRTGKGDEFITCQYRVDFDANSLTRAMYWDRPECANILNPVPNAAPPALAAVAPPVEVQKISLATDALFRFAHGERKDILPEGRVKLDQLAQQLKTMTVEKILVIGHTDRLGTDAYNDALSSSRAKTVVSYLADAGIQSALMHAEGRGKRESITTCDQINRVELISCLQPDRRVELEVTGKSKTLLRK
ncbi:outer membrane protein assembly factor BamE domain-containing protein [Collimonas fungivorans]|uniref:outer membrane protein assembly factor BamE domain-containing protein n=1 Tax=Collimonas fungivorans TaxID=158899 RepID=UPI00077835B0|nr:outer membrane protein assembly factor BamE [Collimonas fungivorans]